MGNETGRRSFSVTFHAAIPLYVCVYSLALFKMAKFHSESTERDGSSCPPSAGVWVCLGVCVARLAAHGRAARLCSALRMVGRGGLQDNHAPGPFPRHPGCALAQGETVLEWCGGVYKA